MTFEPNIPNIALYQARMEKSLIDKLYFLDKTDATTFIDYGCADGVLINTMHKLFPEYKYAGYDLSEEMIKKANSTVGSAEGRLFTTNWNDIEFFMETAGGKKCLILSSIIHEAFSYLNPDELKEFWNRVWNSGFEYIAIRDMMVSCHVNREADPIAVSRVRQIYDPNKIHEWESQWGSLNGNWSLVHFLLTYRYTDNWARELKENYLPINYEDFLHQIPAHYMPMHIEHYTLPFIRQQVEKDFNVVLADRTHLKLILKRL